MNLVLRTALLLATLACPALGQGNPSGPVLPLPATADPRDPLLMPLPFLYTTRGTETAKAKLRLVDTQGQEHVLFEDDRKDVDGDFFTNPIQALAMDPEGRMAVFATMDKASSFAFKKAGGFGFGGISFTVQVTGYQKRDFRGIYLWQKEAGTCKRLWDEKGLEAASDAWRKSPEAKAPGRDVKIHKVLAGGGPLTMHHLSGDRFLLLARGVLFEIQASKPSIRPILGTETEPVTQSWRSMDGHLWFLVAREIPESAPAQVTQEGKVIPTPPTSYLARTAVLEAYEVDPRGTPTSRGILHGMPGATIGTGPMAVVSTEFFRRVYTLEGGIKEGPAAEIKKDKDLTSIHASVDGSGYYLMEDRAFSDDTLVRRGMDHRELWRINLGSTRSGIQLVESGDTVGVLCLNSSFTLRRIVVNRTSGAILSEGPWDIQSGGAAGRALTFGLVRRMAAIPTPLGCLVWLPSNGGKLSGSYEKAGWLSTATQPKESLPGLETGCWYRLESDLILHPLLGRPLADQVVLALGGQTYSFGHPLHAGIRTEDNRRDSRTTREEDQDPFYADGRHAAMTFLGTDILQHPAPALRQWAEASLASQAKRP